MQSRKRTGFTIVELLVVIVVIGILATITIVSYIGLQDRARDAQRQSDLNAIAKALHLYQLDHGDFVETGSGCGGNGNGNGYFNANTGSLYPQSIMDCLLPYTNGRELIDPSGVRACGGEDCYTYMKYTCPTGVYEGTYLYAHLASKPLTDSSVDGTCQSGVDTTYGMNYYVKVD